jgi:TonB family protein
MMRRILLALTFAYPCFAFAQPIDLVNGPTGAIARKFEPQRGAGTDTTHSEVPSCEQPTRPPRALQRFNVQRAYPRSAIELGISGKVQLVVKVSPTGQVDDVVVLFANPRNTFEAPVIAEARRMTFSPALNNCLPVSGDHELTIEFKLAD